MTRSAYQLAYIGILCAFLLPVITAAQERLYLSDSLKPGSIAGLVRDHATGEPLVGALVALDSLPFAHSTDHQGKYLIKNVPPGTYSVRATYIGFEQVVRKGIVVAPGERVTLDIHLRDWWYKQEDAAKEDLARGIVLLKLPGLLAGPFPDSSFTDKYGFRYLPTGCVITGEHLYNAVVEKYLDERNGKGWQQRLEAEWQAYLKKVGRYKPMR
ncbi:MAG TPA: carboxypeptidase-like regulatory domain-containing protein [Nitrososphaera sp.]|nr:carboxypeptidase-like regulatory domain-containing protein [Nitrososphaera sp.]